MTDQRIRGVGLSHKIHGKKAEMTREDPLHLMNGTQAGFHQAIPRICTIETAGEDEAEVHVIEILETKTGAENEAPLGVIDSTEIGGIERGTDLDEVLRGDMIHHLREGEVSQQNSLPFHHGINNLSNLLVLIEIPWLFRANSTSAIDSWGKQHSTFAIDQLDLPS